MRNYFLGALAALVLGLVGCGAKTTINTTPMTDEEKAKVRAEDKQIADEESQGTAGKAKKGGK